MARISWLVLIWGLGGLFVGLTDFLLVLGFFYLFSFFNFCSKFSLIHRVTLLGVEDWTVLREREKPCHISALILLETMLM